MPAFRPSLHSGTFESSAVSADLIKGDGMSTILGSAERVLLCLHYGIGDLVMQLPVLKSLRQHIPQARITALGARPAVQLLADDDCVDAVASIQEWGLRHWYDGGTPPIRDAFGEWLAQERFDVMVDVSHAVRAVREIIWGGDHVILDSDPSRYLPALKSGIAAMNAAVAEGWGMAVNASPGNRIRIGAKRLAWAERWRNREYPAAKPLLGLSPVASSPLKRWPVSLLAATAAELIRRFDCGVIIFGGPQRATADRLSEQLAQLTTPRRVRAMHLLNTAALLRHCALLICNDTGLMHMAAAVGTPVVALFGPSSASIYLPPAGQARALSSEVLCPYRNNQTLGPSECILQGRCLFGQRSCIDSISGDAVTQSATHLIETGIQRRLT
jgi:ADP-heptose:LPS heptosyltransferase